MVELLLTAQQDQSRNATLQQLTAEHAATRLWQRDASLWYPAPATQARIQQRLGWLDLPTDADIVQQIAMVEQAVRERGAKQVVYVVPGVLGRAVRLWLGLVEPRSDLPIIVLDTAEPGAVGAVLALRDQEHTLVVHAGAFDTPQASALAAAVPADLLVPLPPNTGERFGALTVPALLPAALHGLPWHDVLQHVRVGDAAWRDLSEADHPGFQLGAGLSSSAQAGRDLLYLTTTQEQEPIAQWLEAFVGGALGKHRRGFVPFRNHPVVPQQIGHSIVVQLVDERSADGAAVHDDLHRTGVPIIDCRISGSADVAVFVWTWQIAITVAAMVIGLNPFDAPDADVINARVAQQVNHAPVSLPFIPNNWRELLQQARFLALVAYMPTASAPQLEQSRLSLSTALGIPVMLLFPLRDWLWELQLLHAGRPNGTIVVVSADAAPLHDARLAPLHALQVAQVAVELHTWRRMERSVVHVHANKGKASIIAEVLADLLKP